MIVHPHQRADTMSEQNSPVKGDTYVCDTCQMALLVTKDCACEEGEPFFACCGEKMTKKNDAGS